MKKPETVLREFVNRASDETLKFVGGRLSQWLGGDVGDAVEALSDHSDMDRWLHTARSAWELYDMLDQVQEYVEREIRKRNQEDDRSSRASVETEEDGNPVVRRKRFTKAS